MPVLTIRLRRAFTPLRALAAALALLPATPAAAQNVVVMTPTTVTQALAAVRPGDTLRMVGTFDTGLLFRNRDFGNVRVDATQATLRGGIRLQNVQNISFDGGTFGRPDWSHAHAKIVFVEDSRHISFANAVVIGNPAVPSFGLRASGSAFVTVRDSRFVGHADSVVIRASSGVAVARNVFEGVTGDGLKLVDSQRVLVSANSCQNFTPSAGSHPDCIQMLSLSSLIPNTDLFLVNNSTIGRQQGIGDFGSTVPNQRLTLAGNYIVTSSPHWIACSGCINSSFIDNVISNTITSPWVPRIRAPLDNGNFMSGNQVYDIRSFASTDPSYLPPRLFSSLLPSFITGSQWDRGPIQQAAASMAFNASANPEPGTWAMLILGFGLVGAVSRRRRLAGQPRAVAA